MDVAEHPHNYEPYNRKMSHVLVAIQELHKPWNNSDSADEELVCDHCRQADWYEWEYVPYPCPTRLLADDGLNTN